MTPDRAGEWTLTEAARLLEVPQHRLIYLCEKEVVQPDLNDATGRGSSRRFSRRNILEFAVALRLRDIDRRLPPGLTSWTGPSESGSGGSLARAMMRTGRS